MSELLNLFQDNQTQMGRSRGAKPQEKHFSTLLGTDKPKLPPECEQGNVEYKLKLVNPSPSRLEHLITQMKWRLEEGDGEAIYEIGVEDNGGLKGLTEDEVAASLHTLTLMANKIGAKLQILQEKSIGQVRKALEVLVRKILEDKAVEVRLAMLGDVEAGKSSLLGVLTQGELDNGKGRARLNLFRHRHEIRTGRTSSINKEILGFDSNGTPITYSNYQTPEEICRLSSKIIVFIDSGGHPKYLKTTVFSLTAMHADYAILVVNPLTRMDSETTLLHLSLALAMELPVIIVVNKIDLCDMSTVNNTLNQIKLLLSSTAGTLKKPLVIEEENDLEYNINLFKRGHVLCVFLISCVTGAGLDLLYKFLHLLKPTMDSLDKERLMQQNTLFQIDETFNIPNVGIVTSGFLRSGLIEEGSLLKVGPLDEGNFVDVNVSGVQRHKVARNVVRPGESSTLALTSGHQQEVCLSKIIRKGMVLVKQVEEPSSVCHCFEATIFVMPHSNKMVPGFQATVYCENVRQTVVLVAIKEKHSLAANETGTVIAQFLRHPEFICKGYRLLIQQRNTRAIGHVTQVLPHPPHQITSDCHR